MLRESRTRSAGRFQAGKFALNKVGLIISTRPTESPEAMQKVICILGMHRSGTSCLAGSLQEAGLMLGDVNREAVHNKKGNREDPRIWEMHDAILSHSGGSWWQLPDVITWTDEHRKTRDAIIASHSGDELWGFKDPRTLLVFDFWREAIPDLSLIGTFRHPYLVAASLARREGRDVAFWINVWARYNAQLLILFKQQPFSIIRFDGSDEDYRRSLVLVMKRMDLAAPTTMAFFEPELRHLMEAAPLAETSQAMLLYTELSRIAVKSNAVEVASP